MNIRFILALSLGFALAIWLPAGMRAAELQEAQVTQVIQDVRVLPSNAAPRPASLHDRVHQDEAVQTGVQSRSELTFQDMTITRLGSQTIFSFKSGTRTIDLKSGSVLLSVPKNSGGGQIKTAAVTASVTGTKIVMQYHPDHFEFRVLEGDANLCQNESKNVRLRRRDDEPCPDCVVVHAGQMVSGRPGDCFSQPVAFNVAEFLANSELIAGFPPLPGLEQGETAFFRPPGVDVGNVNSTIVGTVNPANVGAGGIVVVSPEHPPTSGGSGE
jgi:FecR protein